MISMDGEIVYYKIIEGPDMFNIGVSFCCRTMLSLRQTWILVNQRLNCLSHKLLKTGIYCLFLSILTSKLIFCQEEDFINVLEKYTSYLDNLNNISYLSQSEGVSLIGNWKNNVSSNYFVIYYDNKIKIEKETNIRHESDSNAGRLFKHEMLFDKELFIDAGISPSGELMVSAEHLPDTPKSSLSEIEDRLCFGYDYFCAYDSHEIESLLDVLNKAIANGAQTNVTATDKVVQLVVQNGHFHFELELSTKHNFALSKIIYMRKGKVLEYETVRVAFDIEEFYQLGNVFYPKKLHIYKIQTLETQNIDAISDQIYNDGSGPYKLKKDSFRFDDYTILWYDINKLDSEPQKLKMGFFIPIPNGTPVYMRDAPQIEYIWMDGKIVPKTDERMLAIARGGHKFMPGPKESRFWLILLGIVGILVGGGWKLYDFWTSDREPTSPQPKDQAV